MTRRIMKIIVAKWFDYVSLMLSASNQASRNKGQTMETQVTTTIVKPRPIHEIAREIKADWRKVSKKGIYFGAVPYLDAMLSMNSAKESYGYDSGSSVILYFLANASTYRGENAKRLKAELKAALK